MQQMCVSSSRLSCCSPSIALILHDLDDSEGLDQATHPADSPGGAGHRRG